MRASFRLLFRGLWARLHRLFFYRWHCCFLLSSQPACTADVADSLPSCLSLSLNFQCCRCGGIVLLILLRLFYRARPGLVLLQVDSGLFRSWRLALTLWQLQSESRNRSSSCKRLASSVRGIDTNREVAAFIILKLSLLPACSHYSLCCLKKSFL
jgi:hypothetical protein